MSDHIAKVVRVQRSQPTVINVTFEYENHSYLSLISDEAAQKMATEVLALCPVQSSSSPRGMVAIMTDPQGRVMASASDFEEHTYSGFSGQEAQTFRVKHALADAIAVTYCSYVIIDGLDKADRYKLTEKLLRIEGFKRTLIPVGWPANAQ